MRTYGTGSVRKALTDGKWKLRYNGKSKTVDATSKRDAELQLPDFIKEIDASAGIVKGAAANAFDTIFRTYMLPDLRAERRKDEAGVLRKYDKHVKDELGAIDVGDLTPQHIEAYKRKRLTQTYGKKKQSYSAGAINRELSIIRRTLELARRQGILKYVVPVPKMREARPRQGLVSERIYRLFLDALPDYAKLPWAFAYHTGVRKGELLSLEWDWMDWDEWILNVPGEVTKNDDPRWIPVYQDASGDDHWRQMVRFAYQSRNERCPYLFQRDGEALTVNQLHWAYVSTRRKLGFGKVIFHDLRRTALSNMMAAGLSESDAMRISGHKTRSVFDRYNIHSREAAKRVRDRMTAHNVAKSQNLGPNLGPNEAEADQEPKPKNAAKYM